MNESTIFGVSVRGLLVFMMTATVCLLAMYMVVHFKVIDKVPEPLYTGFSLALGFYFGQKTSQTGGSNVSQSTASTTVPAAGDKPS